jgi:hypothetical protein
VIGAAQVDRDLQPLAARSRVRSGQPAQLAVDTTNLQFFDPGSGLTVKSG